MNKMKGAVVINTNRCKGCNLCVVACPYTVLELARKKVNASGYAYAQATNAEACVGCAAMRLFALALTGISAIL